MFESAARITFVGTGAIGLPMAHRLVRAGYRVTGVDPNEAARNRAALLGVTTVASVQEAPDADLVIVMVATPGQLQELVQSASAAGSVAGRTWVIMSTVGPESVRMAADALGSAGATVLDAPVTGGVARAVPGELVIFVSGELSTLERLKPVFGALGQVRHVGAGIGEGQSIKIVNQHLCSIHLAAAGEALALARRLGLDPQAVFALIKDGAAGSFMLSDRGPRMLASTQVDVTSSVDIFVKDSGLVSAAARASGADVPLLEAARARFEAAAQAGLGREDDSAVLRAFR